MVAAVPNGHSDFRMPCSNPRRGHLQHRVHYAHEADGRVWDIVIEWTVKEVVHVAK